MQEPQEGAFEDWLHDGQVLCKALNALAPGSVKKVNASKMAFKQVNLLFHVTTPHLDYWRLDIAQRARLLSIVLIGTHGA